MNDQHPPRTELHARFFGKFGGARPQPLPSGAIEVAEAELRAALPLSYKEYASKYNLPGTGRVGFKFPLPEVEPIGLPMMASVVRRGWLTVLPAHVTGLAENSKGNVFDYLVPFGTDTCGNFFCFPRCKEAIQDLPVLFFDHDFGGVRQLAPSFDAFLWEYLRAADGQLRTDLSGTIPSLGQLQFTAEDDHNPTYLEKCDHCGGFGKLFVTKYDVPRNPDDDRPCPNCAGSGWTKKHRFNNDKPPVEVVTGKDGWLKCPNCGWRFSLKDGNAWTGYRHKKCGQRIALRQP